MFAHVPSIVATAGPATAQHLIGLFPASYRERSPDLAYVLGLGGWVDWNFASMLDCFERAERGYGAAGHEERRFLARAYRAMVLIALFRLDEGAALLDSMESATLPIPTRIVMLSARSWLALETGRLNAVAPLRSEMVDLLERVDRIDLWWHTTPPNRVPGLPGMTLPLRRHAEALLRVAGDEPTPLRALGLLSQAWCAFWQGRFAQARALRERAIEHGQWAGDTSAVRSHLLTLTAFLHAIGGDAAAAVDVAHARVRALQASYDARGHYVLFMIAARIASIAEDTKALRGVLDQLDAIEASQPHLDFSYRKWPHAPVIAHFAWLEGRADHAVALWQEALAHEEAIDVYGQAAETRVRLARALARRGEIRRSGTLARARVRAGRRGRHARRCAAGIRCVARARGHRLARRADSRSSAAQLADWEQLVAAERADRSVALSGFVSAHRFGRAGRRPDGPRARRAAANRGGRQQQADRARVRPEPAHRQAPRREHPRQARSRHARPGGCLVPRPAGLTKGITPHPCPSPHWRGERGAFG